MNEFGIDFIHAFIARGMAVQTRKNQEAGFVWPKQKTVQQKPNVFKRKLFSASNALNGK